MDERVLSAVNDFFSRVDGFPEVEYKDGNVSNWPVDVRLQSREMFDVLNSCRDAETLSYLTRWIRSGQYNVPQDVRSMVGRSIADNAWYEPAESDWKPL